MESAILGLVLDSSGIIATERKKQSIPDFIESILVTHGPLDQCLSPVSVAELVHGIYRARKPDVLEQRREYIEEIVSLIPVRPVTSKTAWLMRQIGGQEAASTAF
jgi:hypothetical protein